MSQAPELPPYPPLRAVVNHAPPMAAFVIVIVFYILGQYHVVLPAGVESAIAGLITALMSYLPGRGSNGG